MPVVDVLNLNGKKVGQVDLADAVFGAKVNPHLLHEASRWYQREIRRGTHKTKDKSEVSGAGRKLWKQKGTGRARVGSIRSPLWRHGGTVHGPKPRDYSYALPKKMLLGALRSALSAKLADQKLDRRRRVGARLAQDQGARRSARQAEAQEVVADRFARRESQSRTRQPQPRCASSSLRPTRCRLYDLLSHDLLLLSKDAVARLVRTLDPEAAAAATPHVESIAPAPAAKKEAAPKAAKSGAKKPAAKKAAKPGKKGK